MTDDVLIAQAKAKAAEVAAHEAAAKDAADDAEKERALAADAMARQRTDLAEVAKQLEKSTQALGELAAILDQIMGGEPPADDLIGEWKDITAPLKLEDGAFEPANGFTGVFVVPPRDGKYHKLLGADASDGKQGGVCIGVTARGEFEAWADDGAGIRQMIIPGALTPGAVLFYAVRFVDVLSAWVGPNTGTVPLPNGRKPCDGAAWIGQGIYGHKECDPSVPPTQPRYRAYRELSDAQVAADREEWKALLTPTPPNGGNGGNGGNGDGGDDPPPLDTGIEPKPPTSTTRVEVGVSSETIAAAPPYALIQLAPGTYHLKQINVKEGQTYRGDPKNPGSTVLNGDAAGNAVAFWAGSNVDGIGSPKYVTIQGLRITGYSMGMPRTFSQNPSGNPKDPKAQFGAINRPGYGWIVEDCELVANYMSGTHWCPDGRITRCKVADNGSTGVAGGTLLRKAYLEDCEVANNSRWHLNVHWEAGGIKNSRSPQPGAEYSGAPVIRFNNIHHNWGAGIWFDYQGVEGEIYRNSIWENSHMAIVIEVGAAVYIHHNQMGRNAGSGGTSGIFRGEVSFQNAKRCRAERNLFYVSKNQSFFIGQQGGRGGSCFSGYAGGNQNAIIENTFVITSQYGGFDLLHDWGEGGSDDIECTGVASGAPAPGKNLPANKRWNHFCFVARPGSGNSLFTDFRKNTIRSDRQITVNPRYGPQDTRFGPAIPEPDWTKLPTWDVPPGYIAQGS